MNQYEALLILDPNFGDSDVENVVKACQKHVEERGGKVLDQQRLGKKPLGYTMKKHREGQVVVCNIELPANKANDLVRAFRLEEKILKANFFSQASVNVRIKK